MCKIPRHMARIWTVGLMLVWSTASPAQGVDPGIAYSQGVHAYFAGRTNQANHYLSIAQSIDPTDPRTYYFRALSLLRLGRRDEAQLDMRTGAALEAREPNRFAVGIALERVQGGDRLLLERFRREGRVAEANLSIARERSRYEQITEREPEVLHQRVMIPLDRLLGSDGAPPMLVIEPLVPIRPAPPADAAPSPVAGGGVPAAAQGSPFGDDPTAPAAAATSQPPAPPAAARPTVNENPFGIVPPSGSGATPIPPTAGEKSVPAPGAGGDADNPFRSG
jgi:hypothetical protein